MTRAHLESLLFTSAKVLTKKELVKILDIRREVLETWLAELAAIYNVDGRGIRLVTNGEEVQFFTAPECREFIEGFLKEEITGELTRPQLETLTIVAYRGPISKPEIEQIRGINCSVILRNLLWRGLIQETKESTVEIPVYEVTMDFVRYLGVEQIAKLPHYEQLHLCELSSSSSSSPLASV